jgi:hypothetical protein
VKKIKTIRNSTKKEKRKEIISPYNNTEKERIKES